MSDQIPKLGEDGSILEGIVTSLSDDDSVNISPMGPIVDTNYRRFVFRPFRTSTTYQNLKRTGKGVFHVTDDVLLFAQAAIGQPEPMPQLEGLILTEACRWYEFEIESLDDSSERTCITARTIGHGRFRDFFGFNRAKHAVIEAAIVATRIHLLSAAAIEQQLEQLALQVNKTANSAEHHAFDFLAEYIHRELSNTDRVEKLP